MDDRVGWNGVHPDDEKCSAKPHVPGMTLRECMEAESPPDKRNLVWWMHEHPVALVVIVFMLLMTITQISYVLIGR